MKKILLSVLCLGLTMSLTLPISALQGANASGDAEKPPVSEPTVEEKVDDLVNNGFITEEQKENISNVFFAPVVSEKTQEETPDNVKVEAGTKFVTKHVVSADIKATVEYDDGKEDLVITQGGEFTKPVKVEITLGSETIKELTGGVAENSERQFYVIREHNGVTETIPAKLIDGKLVFYSDKFSDFFIAYQDVEKPLKETTIKFEGLKNTYTVGDVVEFKITVDCDKRNEGTVMVVGKGLITAGKDLVSLEYKEGDKWIKLEGNQFGIDKGFPLMNASSEFRATFKGAGSTSYKITLENVDNGEVLASDTLDIKVNEKESKPEVKPESKPTVSCKGEKDKNCDGIITCDEEHGEGWVWNESKKACEFRGRPVVDTSVRC